MYSPRHQDDPALSALWDDVMQARADGRSRPPTNSHDRQQMHARLADAMEAYAGAIATAGMALPSRFSDEMKLHRSKARDARIIPE